MEKNDYEEQLSNLRGKVDEIDRRLLPLFLERMRTTDRIGELKKQAGASVLNSSREQLILDGIREKSGDYALQAAALYSSILSMSRMRQSEITSSGGALREMERSAQRILPASPAGVVCQGVEGAYSHKAARKLFGGADIYFEPSWKQVFEDVENGQAQFGVLPVENSAAGSVSGVYDLILSYRFYIADATTVAVNHCLASFDGAGEIEKVISHPQALSQCSEFTGSRGLRTADYSNTAAAAKYVSEEKPSHTGVICSREAAEKYGLVILRENIQNSENNATRFIVISKDPILPEDANKISLCFSIPHKPGALYGVLERFAMLGLNMTKIESRPIPGRSFEYDFYLDFTGCIHEKHTLELICALHDELPRFSFLGNYTDR